MKPGSSASGAPPPSSRRFANRAQFAETDLQSRRRAAAAAFEFEQVLRDGPTFVLRPDAIRLRHADVVEEHLVHFVVAASVMIGFTVMPGVFISISRNVMPACALPVSSVRTRQKM